MSGKDGEALARPGGEPTSRPMVGGASAFGGKPPRVLVLALKQGGGLLFFPARVRDPTQRQWAEVPPMPEAEAELRAAHARAMKQAPEGAKAREGRGVKLPKLEFGPNGRVRVDVTWSGVQHHLYPATLTPAARAAFWKLWVEPLPVADIPKLWPATFQVSARSEGEAVGGDRTLTPKVLTGGFEREFEMQEALVRKWDTLPLSKLLTIIGREYPTGDRGRIDILCKNVDDSGYTVIELKRGQTGDAVVGQVLRYMGSIREELVRGDQLVWGIIICREVDPRLAAAISMVANVEVYTYVYNADGGQFSLSKFSKKN
jgi:hypothetical protein